MDRIFHRQTDRRGRRESSVGLCAAVVAAGIAILLLLASIPKPGAAVHASGSLDIVPPESPVIDSPIKPSGLIAVEDYNVGQQLTPAVYANTAISGVAIRVNWSDMESTAPTPANPDPVDWSITDEVFTQAEANNKFVVLILVPGFGCVPKPDSIATCTSTAPRIQTPAWALATGCPALPAGAPAGHTCVQTDVFTPQYGPLLNANSGVSFSLPVPWDQAYLGEWFAFLQLVQQRYGGKPASDFRMIAADGPTSVSEEMTLPNKDLDPNVAAKTKSDIAEWIDDGYTPAAYEAAWQSVFTEYHSLFPSQYISLSLGYGLPIPGAGERKDTPESIVDNDLPLAGMPALQENQLTECSGAASNEAYDLVKQYSGAMVTGFEVGALNMCGPADACALNTALENGEAAHADFLEVYAQDVLNPAMQSVLQAAAAGGSDATVCHTPVPRYSPGGSDAHCQIHHPDLPAPLADRPMPSSG